MRDKRQETRSKNQETRGKSQEIKKWEVNYKVRFAKDETYKWMLSSESSANRLSNLATFLH